MLSYRVREGQINYYIILYLKTIFLMKGINYFNSSLLFNQINSYFNNKESVSFSTNSSNSNKSLIWVYNVISQSIVEQAPFISKSACAKALGINRHTVASYLDQDKVLKHKWVFSSTPLNKQDLSKWLIKPILFEAMVGDLLGDGHITKPNNTNSSRLEFTFSVQNLPYLNHLKFNIYKDLCTLTDPTPYPNPELTGKEITQYWFSSLTSPALAQIYNIWYKEIDGKITKILPDSIESILTPVGLAHWILLISFLFFIY